MWGRAEERGREGEELKGCQPALGPHAGGGEGRRVTQDMDSREEKVG